MSITHSHTHKYVCVYVSKLSVGYQLPQCILFSSFCVCMTSESGNKRVNKLLFFFYMANKSFFSLTFKKMLFLDYYTTSLTFSPSFQATPVYNQPLSLQFYMAVRLVGLLILWISPGIDLMLFLGAQPETEAKDKCLMWEYV